MAASEYLGPATVLSVDGRRVHLECPDAFPWATLALAHTYQPLPGDTVLAINRGPDWYVIGVLAGHGSTTFHAPADLTLRAPHGRITLDAGEGVAISGRRVELTGETLLLSARSVVERFVDATRWVERAFLLRLGRLRARVKEDCEVAAGEVTVRADADVRIDGETIHLS